mmetsp:Transcript_22428/g.48715  ORF Transcript_22428/g.48715 Transcript_22428/m.48715 type:complete len:290 (+) Transcript_22428:156-1025(+)
MHRRGARSQLDRVVSVIKDVVSVGIDQGECGAVELERLCGGGSSGERHATEIDEVAAQTGGRRLSRHRAFVWHNKHQNNLVSLFVSGVGQFHRQPTACRCVEGGCGEREGSVTQPETKRELEAVASVVSERPTMPVAHREIEHICLFSVRRGVPRDTSLAPAVGLAENGLGDRLRSIETRVPGGDDGGDVTRDTEIEWSTMEEDQHGGFAQSLHLSSQFLLESRKRDIVTIMSLPLNGSVNSHHQHHHISVFGCGDSRGDSRRVCGVDIATRGVGGRPADIELCNRLER